MPGPRLLGAGALKSIFKSTLKILLFLILKIFLEYVHFKFSFFFSGGSPYITPFDLLQQPNSAELTNVGCISFLGCQPRPSQFFRFLSIYAHRTTKFDVGRGGLVFRVSHSTTRAGSKRSRFWGCVQYLSVKLPNLTR